MLLRRFRSISLRALIQDMIQSCMIALAIILLVKKASVMWDSLAYSSCLVLDFLAYSRDLAVQNLLLLLFSSYSRVAAAAAAFLLFTSCGPHYQVR